MTKVTMKDDTRWVMIRPAYAKPIYTTEEEFLSINILRMKIRIKGKKAKASNSGMTPRS